MEVIRGLWGGIKKQRQIDRENEAKLARKHEENDRRKQMKREAKLQKKAAKQQAKASKLTSNTSVPTTTSATQPQYSSATTQSQRNTTFMVPPPFATAVTPGEPGVGYYVKDEAVPVYNSTGNLPYDNPYYGDGHRSVNTAFNGSRSLNHNPYEGSRHSLYVSGGVPPANFNTPHGTRYTFYAANRVH